VAAATGARFDGLFLVADLATRLERVGSRHNDASDAEATVVAQQQYYQLGEIDWTEVDASGTPDDTLARARAAIEQ
jgi:predicted kinase